MMGISPTELLVIAVVALIVIGLKELPTALRSMGRSVRALVDEFVRDSEIDTLRREIMDTNRSTGKVATKGKRVPAVGDPPPPIGGGPSGSEPGERE